MDLVLLFGPMAKVVLYSLALFDGPHVYCFWISSHLGLVLLKNTCWQKKRGPCVWDENSISSGYACVHWWINVLTSGLLPSLYLLPYYDFHISLPSSSSSLPRLIVDLVDFEQFVRAFDDLSCMSELFTVLSNLPTFDLTMLLSMIVQMGVKFWSSNCPPVLLWLVAFKDEISFGVYVFLIRQLSVFFQE